MPQYVVFAVDDDEDAWESASEETKQERFDHDYAFGQLLESRGRTPRPSSRSVGSTSSSATTSTSSSRRPA
jgi:hypothetical protein